MSIYNIACQHRMYGIVFSVLNIFRKETLKYLSYINVACYCTVWPGIHMATPPVARCSNCRPKSWRWTTNGERSIQWGKMQTMKIVPTGNVAKRHAEPAIIHKEWKGARRSPQSTLEHNRALMAWFPEFSQAEHEDPGGATQRGTLNPAVLTQQCVPPSGTFSL